jgi:hypothetical protein
MPPTQPSQPRWSRFDRLSSADRLLLSVGVLFFLDCFAHWQSTCCPRPNAWAGNASIPGALAALSALALAVWVLLPLAGVRAAPRRLEWLPWSGSAHRAGSARKVGSASESGPAREVRPARDSGWTRLGSGRPILPDLPVGTWLACAALAFGTLKFLVVLFHRSAVWAFAGLGLLALAAYGAYMKLEERRAGGPLPRRSR